MSAGGYEAFFQNPKLGPGWMHKRWGQAFWRSIGRVLDEQNDLLRAAMLVRNPDGAVEQGRGDALDFKGDDLGLPRGGTAPNAIDESDASYAARLKSPWTTWGQDPVAGAGAGSAKGILQQLQIAGFPIAPTGPGYASDGALLVNHLGYMQQLREGEIITATTAGICINRQYKDGTMPAPGAELFGWTLDARDQFYSKWMLVFLQDVPSLTDDDNDVKARLNQICKRWKSGSAIYCGAAIVPAENSAKCIGWPKTLTFGAAGLTFGANGARFINPE